MMLPGRFHLLDWLGLGVLLLLALGCRAGYLLVALDSVTARPILEVQGISLLQVSQDGRTRLESETLLLARNIADYDWFGGPAPLAAGEEVTAHTAPGYPWLVSLALRFTPDPESWIRWAQCGLGVATVLLLFFFVRRAFGGTLVPFLAGLLAAIHPFWIVNTAEIADGTAATFLAVASFALGTRAAQQGGAFASLLFGLTLAALAMIRAAFLPFAVVALLWFLWHCRTIPGGWFCGLLAFLGLGNGLAPWLVRNLQVFGEPLPVVSSLHLHLWIGNLPRGEGGGSSHRTNLDPDLPPEERKRLLAIEHQPTRYADLGRQTLERIVDDPGTALGRRIDAGLGYVVGERWFRRPGPTLVEVHRGGSENPPADWLADHAETLARTALWTLVVLGLLGWRFAYARRDASRLVTLAAVWFPLPYLLTHAERLSGPRLPFDAVAICFAAYALSRLFPSGASENFPSD